MLLFAGCCFNQHQKNKKCLSWKQHSVFGTEENRIEETQKHRIKK